ncbi:MAG: HD domain-containing protein [Acidobacteriota bacterium]|nr:HD domain-containing protein [Acidobacteriota bacterium]MDQ5836569.1 HD domain-containing protein [Acidobacteriota bacterium]
MFDRFRRIRLLYIVLGTLLVVGLLPLCIVGWMLSDRSANELRSVEGRYQAQLVQDKARQIELYGQRYREVVTGLARAFELTGGVSVLERGGSDERFQKAVEGDRNLDALAILPVTGTPHVAYKPDAITREEVNARVNVALAGMAGPGVRISGPHLVRSSQEMALTIAAPVMGGSDGGEVVAAVVAVVSFQDVFASVQQATPMSERELLERGLPVVFVVNQDGRAVVHPDARVAFAERSMSDLKVVQDWNATGRQVKSALAPFNAQRDGKEVRMLGAYATARLDEDTLLGVIAVQDEHAALQSVTDMRRQTLYISLFAASFALLIGFLFAKQLANPVRDLAEGAHRIAGGDFTRRIEVRSRTELGELGESFNLMTDRLEHYIEDLRRAAEENRELFIGTVKALAAAIDGKDPYTRGHSERVSRFSLAIGERLGLPDEELEKLRISALLHDVGKISIEDRILKKPASLTPEEFEIMKQHPQKGYKIMSQIPAMRDFLPGMYMHHEMMDGHGYPQGLKGDQIPMQARIVSVADTFDAMTTDRPYQKGMSLEEAIARVKTFVGTRYDAQVVAALCEACETGQITPGRVRLSKRTQELSKVPHLQNTVQAAPLPKQPANA